MPRYYADEEDELEGDGLVGDERDDGDGTMAGFFSPPHDRAGSSFSQWWGNKLHRNPHNKPNPSMRQGADEIRWGDVNTQGVNVPALGTVQSQFPPPQLIQATRPARVWTINVGAVIQAGAAQLDPLHVVVQVLFRVWLNTGNASMRQYVSLDFNGLTNDFVAFLGDAPTASKFLINQPAKQVIVEGFWQWRTDGTGTPYPVNIQMQAAVAPVER